MPLPADVARRVSFRVQQDRQGRLLRVHYPPTHGQAGICPRHRCKACPCQDWAKQRKALGDGDKTERATGAALDRILISKACQEIWKQVTKAAAGWLIATALEGFTHEPSLGTDTADRHAGWALAAADARRLQSFIIGHAADLELRLAAQAAKPRRQGEDMLRRRDHAMSRQWQATLAAIVACLEAEHRGLGKLDRSLAPPVPPSRNCGTTSAKVRHAAKVRHVVLKLMAVMQDDQGLGIASHQRHKITADLASAALGLTDDEALDELRVRNILETENRRRRRQRGHSPLK